MIKLIIFDWDDVFTLGSKEAYLACFHQSLVQLGVRLAKKEEERRITLHWGNTDDIVLKELLREHPELVEKAARLYEENLFGDTFANYLKLVPGSIELLNRLKGKYILTIATGAHPKLLKEKIMPKFDIPDVFSHIISAYDVDADKTKPHPFSVEEIMKREKVTKQETVVVGDSWSDVKMALSGGVIPIVPLTGQLSKKEAQELGVKYIIEDVTKVEVIIEQINAKLK